MSVNWISIGSACSAPNHYLNQCCIIVNGILRNFSLKLFIDENIVSKMAAILSRWWLNIADASLNTTMLHLYEHFIIMWQKQASIDSKLLQKSGVYWPSSVTNPSNAMTNMVNIRENSHNRHPIARPLGKCMGVSIISKTLIYVMPESLPYCTKYHVIFNHIITALDCICRDRNQLHCTCWHSNIQQFLTITW